MNLTIKEDQNKDLRVTSDTKVCSEHLDDEDFRYEFT